jgi:hypothetical protein
MKVPRRTIRPAVEQAMAYLAKCPPAIQGQDGNSTTARLAKAVVLGFDLDPHTALSAFRPWNATCQPPWDEKELLRLLEAAAKWPGERGNLLAKDGQEPFTPPPAPAPKPVAPVVKHPPKLDGFRMPTLVDLKEIAFYREYGLPGLVWAAHRGVLVVGQWSAWKCYGVTDSSGRVIEVRRVDNEPFPEMGPLPVRKSHSLKGSEKHWPLGIQEAVDYPAIALVEGVPDFLVAHDVVIWEQGTREHPQNVKCAPVAMLSASPAIHADALPFFKGKHVRIFAHAEAAGLAGAEKWRRQLLSAGVSDCILFDFSAYHEPATGTIPNDLDEFMGQRTRWQPRKPSADWTTDFKVMPC